MQKDRASFFFLCLVVLQMSIIHIMIDNCLYIFREDEPIIHDDSQKWSVVIKTLVSTAATAHALKKDIEGHSEKTSNANTEELLILSASFHAEVPTL